MQDKNLIPFNKRTENEQREIATAGGIASGKSRKKKASLRKALQGYLRDNPDEIEEIVKGLIGRAKRGDPKAIERVQELLKENANYDKLAFEEKQYRESRQGKTSADISMLFDALTAPDPPEDSGGGI